MVENNNINSQIIISFCIPVYNQLELLKECIKSIVSYKGNDVEIIICDDYSTEDIINLISSFDDSRIKYFRNDNNIGHSLNILKALRLSSGKYAFLLRTRDQVISSCIPDIVDFVNTHPNCSYLTGNALDEEGHIRYSYNKTVVKQGIDALKAHFNLYVHPSGSIYSLEKLNLSELQYFIETESLNKQSFVAHSLMRMRLAERGDFGFILKPMWIYNNPKENDIAVNKAPNSKSVFDPMYLKQRFNYQLLWGRKACEEKHWAYIVTELYKSYLYDSTWRFYYGNKDEALKKHYSFETRSFSVHKEIIDFDEFASQQIKEIYGEDFFISIKNQIRNIKRKNSLFGWSKGFVQYVTKNKATYRFCRILYRKMVNRRF